MIRKVIFESKNHLVDGIYFWSFDGETTLGEEHSLAFVYKGEVYGEYNNDPTYMTWLSDFKSGDATLDDLYDIAHKIHIDPLDDDELEELEDMDLVPVDVYLGKEIVGKMRK